MQSKRYVLLTDFLKVNKVFQNALVCRTSLMPLSCIGQMFDNDWS